MNNDFRNYAVKHLGMNGLALDQYIAATGGANITSSYISPTIIEERQLNVAQMDVFSRLMMDRIIFLGTDVNDYTANVIQYMIQCSMWPAMWPRYVPVWPHLWLPYFSCREKKANALL